MKVLRPELYDRLVKVFKKVRVVKQGLAIQWKIRSGANGKPERYFDRAGGDAWGEYYTVNCPHCHDKRSRLSINHMWGYYDPLTCGRSLWLIKCHHQDCFNTGAQQWQFYKDLYQSTGMPTKADVVVKGVVSKKVPGEVDWPGTCWPINRMPEDCPARQYLQSRNFNQDWLWDQFRVSVLVEAKPELFYLRDRIIIPVFMEKKLVGWQARYVGKPPSKDIKKYLTMSGMSRDTSLYNFDSAVQYPYVFMVEGPTDVWKLGPEAVAVLGKPTSFQSHLIAARWKTAVILLDEDASKESSEQLTLLSRAMRVAWVKLPEGMDPGDFQTTAEIRAHVANDLNRQGFPLI